MSNDKVRVPVQDVQALKSNTPLFSLGRIVATRAVLSLMEEHAVFPAALLSRHQHGDWGGVGPEDAKSNDEAILSGARLISSFQISYVVIWVITDAVGDDGNRTCTCLMFPEEY